MEPSTIAKPPYRVPSMAEVGRIEPNGYTMVSTFSGCGGSCLGFEMAGYRVLWANEFIPAAQEVYKLNHPGVILDTRDIRTVTGAEILAAVGRKEIDVFEGSPPCAAFSTAGKRNKTWGKVRSYSDGAQQTDDLFSHYTRLLKELQPRAFVAENVPGLARGVAKGYFIEIMKELQAAGYVVECRKLDASWLGVPQARQRMIFQGLRKDIAEKTGLRPRWPKPMDFQYTVRDALPWIVRQADNGGFGKGGMRDATVPSPTIGATRLVADGHGYYPGTDLDVSKSPAPTIPATPGGSAYYRHRIEERVIHDTRSKQAQYSMGDITDKPSPAVTAGGAGQWVVESRRIQHKDVVDENTAASIDGYAIGDEWDKLKPGESSDKYLNLAKAHPDKPVPTVTSSGGPGSTTSVTHPYERRKFTIAELKRLCAFPDDFQLTGSYAQQWERLGRAVPPLMMRAVALEVRELLKDVDSACAAS